jgi:hypothetical protein
MSDGRSIVRKLLTLTVPAIVVGGLFLATCIELWVRATWDSHKGSPGLFVSHPVRGQQLASNYAGWFAGVPVRINNLGFRDERDYQFAKSPQTFRILILGDSVTFGHGAVYSYPQLLENLLRQWRPDVDWQVWNAGVPGYNTTQELAHLLEIGPEVRPDLVIVGFFDNDIIDNQELPRASPIRVARSRVMSWIQQHVYSYEFYKRIALQLAWRLSGEDTFRLRLEHLGTEEALIAQSGDANEQRQAITAYDRLTDEQIRGNECDGGERPNPSLFPAIRQQAGWDNWLAAVRRFQDLNRDGSYRIVFFLNIVPAICQGGDYFYEGGSRLYNDFFAEIIGKGLPTVSALDGFLHRRPSQMPLARTHAIGNSNMTKAEILFQFLRDSVLPPLNTPALTQR